MINTSYIHQAGRGMVFFLGTMCEGV